MCTSVYVCICLRTCVDLHVCTVCVCACTYVCTYDVCVELGPVDAKECPAAHQCAHQPGVPAKHQDEPVG